jgi:predicted ABC-type ATPase
MKAGVDFGTYINADDLAREHHLVGDDGSLKAQQMADAAREQCLAAGKSFSFETVMSHESKIQFMHRAKAAGFFTQLYFVATGDPKLNVGRVRTRVASGGHDVPEDRIFARYHRTIGLLPQAMLASDRAVVFDNSIASDADEMQRLRPVMESQLFESLLKIVPLPPVPLWTIEALKFAALSYALKEISNHPRELIFSLSPCGSFETTRIPDVDAAFHYAATRAIEMNERGKPVKMNVSWPLI